MRGTGLRSWGPGPWPQPRIVGRAGSTRTWYSSRLKIVKFPQAISEARDEILVVAFGGNALLKRGEELTASAQQRNAKVAAQSVAELIHSYTLCITHGNGPQVGMLAKAFGVSTGLDVLDAETEGSIGYMLELEIGNTLGNAWKIVTMLTQVVVDPDDPAFQRPSKPIGEMYTKEQAVEVMKTKPEWSLAEDGSFVRRVVPSPPPQSIVESDSILLLLKNGITVICCGGGGIPVREYEHQGLWRRAGMEAVIDKDATSAKLAEEIGASKLLLLTDADAIYDPKLWPEKKIPLPKTIHVSEICNMEFASGSMGPKVKAACSFVERTGGTAGIGRMEDALEIVKGKKGTTIVR